MSDLFERISEQLKKRRIKLVTAESCTGGLIAAGMTDFAGSSEVFDRGLVTYSNEAKQELLGVSADTLSQFGAVSEQTAQEMAAGALQNSHADIALSVTGIAGPSGGSAEKPVGTVCFGVSIKSGTTYAETQHFDGSRAEIREASVKHAVSLGLKALEN